MSKIIDVTGTRATEPSLEEHTEEALKNWVKLHEMRLAAAKELLEQFTKRPQDTSKIIKLLGQVTSQ